MLRFRWKYQFNDDDIRDDESISDSLVLAEHHLDWWATKRGWTGSPLPLRLHFQVQQIMKMWCRAGLYLYFWRYYFITFISCIWQNIQNIAFVRIVYGRLVRRPYKRLVTGLRCGRKTKRSSSLQGIMPHNDNYKVKLCSVWMTNYQKRFDNIT